MANIYIASRQWATRPLDERFWGLDDMLNSVLRRKSESAEKNMAVRHFAVQPDSHDNLTVVGPAGNPAELTHYSFAQLSRFANAPAEYLRSIPAPIAASCINHGLQLRGDNTAQLLLRKNGHTELRSITTDQYSRIWDADIITSLKPHLRDGWRIPPARPNTNDRRSRPATESDILPGQSDFGLSIKVGDTIAPAGCYASDHDSFIFLVNSNRIINDGGKGLMRGMFVSNSEVGAGSFKIHAFMVENVCGNHICWNTSASHKVRIIHKGAQAKSYGMLVGRAMRVIEQETDSEIQKMIVAARHTELGHDMDSVVDELYGNRKIGLTRKELESGWQFAELHESAAKSAPTTIWGIHHGLTRFSQTLGMADERMRIDSAAGRILALAA